MTTDLLTILLVGLFLPLFPLSAAFNVLFAYFRHPLVRSIMLLAWPQAGALVLSLQAPPPSEWLPLLGVLTSILYAVRALALREMGRWTGFFAVSSWSLLWIPWYQGVPVPMLHFYAFGFSMPLVLLAMLIAGLERRFGAAYAGLYGGLGCILPRLSGVLVFVVLAITATPVFPAFFAMLSIIVQALPVAPALAAGVGATWLTWSWAGARLLQGVLVGPGREEKVRDLGLGGTWAYALVLVLLVMCGLAATAAMR